MYRRSLVLVVFNSHEYTVVARSKIDTKLEAMQPKFKSLDETSGRTKQTN